MLPPIWLALHGHLLFWSALGLVLASGWRLERAVRRWRSRRAWRARAGALPRASGDAATDEPVRLSGIVRIEGKAARRFEDGEPAAVASAAAGPRAEQDAECVSVRAARVWLDTKQGAIELRGPIEIVGGRTVRTAGAPSGLAWSRLSAALGNEPDWAFTSLPVELRSIAAGDRVEVAGTLERAIDGDGSDYRSTMRRVMVPSAASILVQLAAPAPARSWRGPLALLVVFAIANAALVRIPQRWDGDVDPLALVNPITRPRALRVVETTVREHAESALFGDSHFPASEVSLLNAVSDLSCADRARLLRASGDLDGALDEASTCAGSEAGRERTLALFGLRREEDAMSSWGALLRDVDAACDDEPYACDLSAIELSTSDTSLNWGNRIPSAVPRQLFIGHRSVQRPHIARRLHRLLGSSELRSASMRLARISWTLELAAFEIEVEQLARASELLDEARRRLLAGELPARLTDPLLRDEEHLRVIVFVRRGDLELASQMVHRSDGDLPCPMRGVLAAARDPFTNGAEAIAGERQAYDRVREAFVSLSAPPASAWIHDRQALAWIEHFGRVARPAHLHDLRTQLGEPRTCGGHVSLDAAAWDGSLLRAYRALGNEARAERVRGCIDRAREALLALPPLERHQH